MSNDHESTKGEAKAKKISRLASGYFKLDRITKAGEFLACRMTLRVLRYVLIFLILCNPFVTRTWASLDLSDWLYVTHDEQLEPSPYAVLGDGHVRLHGKNKGYLRSREVYAEYRLSIEWRWPEGGGNSGLLLHLTDPDQIWPRCVQIQLRSKRAGEVILTGVGVEASQGALLGRVTREEHPYFAFHPLASEAEKEVGMWNQLEVIVRGDTLVVLINGILHNQLSGINLTHGALALQSADKPVEFRHFKLLPLSDERAEASPAP